MTRDWETLKKLIKISQINQSINQSINQPINKMDLKGDSKFVLSSSFRIIGVQADDLFLYIHIRLINSRK